MNEIHFEWNRLKSLVNKRKHGVSFEEAKTVFYDENAVQFDDPDHSTTEDRFIMIGISFKLRVLVVSHCERQGVATIQRAERGRGGVPIPERSADVIRIISARKAARHEVKYYEEGKI